LLIGECIQTDTKAVRDGKDCDMGKDCNVKANCVADPKTTWTSWLSSSNVKALACPELEIEEVHAEDGGETLDVGEEDTVDVEVQTSSPPGAATRRLFSTHEVSERVRDLPQQATHSTAIMPRQHDNNLALLMEDRLGDSADVTAGGYGKVFKAITKPFRKIIERIKTVVRKVIKTVVKVVMLPVRIIKKAAKVIVKVVKNAAKTVWKALPPIIKKVVKTIVKVVMLPVKFIIKHVVCNAAAKAIQEVAGDSIKTCRREYNRHLAVAYAQAWKDFPKLFKCNAAIQVEADRKCQDPNNVLVVDAYLRAAVNTVRFDLAQRCIEKGECTPKTLL